MSSTKIIGQLYIILATLSLGHSKELPIEELIEGLSKIDDHGYGYSVTFAGSQFLPRPDSSWWGVGIVGAPAPEDSGTLRMIVERGAEAIPFLVKSLDDDRPIKVKPVGAMWIRWNDEYDYNRRTRGGHPKGVNRDSFGEEHHPRRHQITVGDLCFVALGQIVNRHFSATRYQPTGGLIVSSPTYSETLLKVIRNEYLGMTVTEHRKQLIDDFTRPDHTFRRNGAAMRLAYYYPGVLDELVVKQLATPTYDPDEVSPLLEKILYPEKDPKKRVQLFKDFQAKHGAASKDGVLLQLFDDLDDQIAVEEGRMQSPWWGDYDARDVLVQIFGYEKNVRPEDRPYVDSWCVWDVAELIEAIGRTPSPVIQKEVNRIFSSAGDDDELALACIKVLQGTGRDDALIAHCQARLKKEGSWKSKLGEAFEALKKSKEKSAERMKGQQGVPPEEDETGKPKKESEGCLH